jgi:hypothetical protein
MQKMKNVVYALKSIKFLHISFHSNIFYICFKLGGISPSDDKVIDDKKSYTYGDINYDLIDWNLRKLDPNDGDCDIDYCDLCRCSNQIWHIKPIHKTDCHGIITAIDDIGHYCADCVDYDSSNDDDVIDVYAMSMRCLKWAVERLLTTHLKFRDLMDELKEKHSQCVV